MWTEYGNFKFRKRIKGLIKYSIFLFKVLGFMNLKIAGFELYETYFFVSA